MDEPSSSIEEIRKEIAVLRKENEDLRKQLFFHNVTDTIKVPENFREVFSEAEKSVKSYFSKASMGSERGEITINGERYLLVRSAALSFEFMDVFTEFYSNKSPGEAVRIGNNFLFDIAHVLGKEDARAFHKKMNLVDPIQKLATGPVNFAFTGWANVEILPESNPSPNKDFYLKYCHHNSFEAQSWIKAGRHSDVPVCIMNGGYSSGWCEESFGLSLTAVEIECEAHGAKHCTFIMAPPDRINDYLKQEKGPVSDVEHEVPVFFERKYNEDKLRQSLDQKETLLQEVHHRVKNNLQVISSLLNLQKAEVRKELRGEFDTIIGRVKTMAKVQDLIYSASNVSSINIELYFKELVSSLHDLYASPDLDTQFKVEIHVKEAIFNPDFAIPLGLIVNEIACNSFKYALRENGLFYLKLNQTKAGNYLLCIGDNGQGINNEINSDSLGMSLIEILCEQLEAKLEIVNSNSGLQYEIEFRQMG